MLLSEANAEEVCISKKLGGVLHLVPEIKKCHGGMVQQSLVQSG